MSVFATSAEDIAAYPEFANSMQVDGSNYGWKSYQVTTESGYKVLMFRITADELNTPLIDSKGPVVYLHGIFSDPTDFLMRTDTTMPSSPV